MSEPYVPKVNDYVVWDKGKYGSDEGWVYFFCEEYITIETGVRPKPKDRYAKNEKHKYIHTLLLCHSHCWKELKYVKSRKSKHPHHYSECED
tara:strand:+ start:376 stop:651 length:276 start_codon:yes stop_codon:yes gene_type:complete